MKWIVCCRAAHSLRSWLCVMGYGFDAQQTQLHSTQLHSINLSFVSLISILPSLLLFINDWRGKLSWWNQLWLMKSILNAAEGRCPPITSNWRKKEKRSESNQSIPQLIWLMDCFLFKERGREEELIKKKTFNLFHEINWYYTSKMSKSNSTNFHQIFNLIERVDDLISWMNSRLAGISLWVNGTEFLWFIKEMKWNERSNQFSSSIINEIEWLIELICGAAPHAGSFFSSQKKRIGAARSLKRN